MNVFYRIIFAFAILSLTVTVKADDTRSGQAIYERTCTACHATGAAGAPKFGDSEAWAGRLQASERSGLYESALSGTGAMPARGACGDCSDTEIKGAVDYMLEQSLQ